MTKFYEGKPCRNCGGTTRYSSVRTCVACAKLNKTNINTQRKYNLKRKYGLSLAEYDTMVSKQGGCAICGNSTKRLHVDHDHATGRIRGLLCMDCNTGIGKLRDDVGLVQRALEYLS